MSTENKNLIKCKVCGEEIAKSAKTCPKCGAKVKKPIYKKWWFIAIVIVAIIIAISSAGGSKDTTETTNTSNVSAPQETIEYTKYDVSTLLDELEWNALSAEEKHNKEYVEITGNGPVDAVKQALHNQTGVDFKILDYTEHALGEGSNAKAAAYVNVLDLNTGIATYGVGQSTNITRASIRAVFSALNRLAKK